LRYRQACAERAFDICEPWAETYFYLMPIHEKLRGRDFQTIRNHPRSHRANIHDEFTKRLDGGCGRNRTAEGQAWVH
jgi:hypothetical protein